MYARCVEQGPEVRRIEGISINDQVPEARQRACGVGEVAGGLDARGYDSRRTSQRSARGTTEGCLRRRERRYLGQKLSAEGLTFQGEQTSLGIGEAKTLGPGPGPEHAVLGAQILDCFALPTTDPAGDK